MLVSFQLLGFDLTRISHDPRPQASNSLGNRFLDVSSGERGYGVTPRIGLGIWQTVCMVSFADYVKAW